MVCFKTRVRLRSVATKNERARRSLYIEMDVLVEDVAVELDVLVLVLVLELVLVLVLALVEEPELDVDERTSVPVSSPAR